MWGLISVPLARPDSRPHVFGSSALRLRGGLGEEDVINYLRDLLGRRQGGEVSVVDLVLDNFQRLPPATRALLFLNVGMYLLARLGFLGRDPAASLGSRSDKVLKYPRQNLYRIITAQFLHLSQPHLVSNMLMLLAIGSKIERRLGSRRFAQMILFLLPLVGVTQLAINILLNGIGVVVGIRDVGERHINMDSPRSGRRTTSLWKKIVQHQISFSTTSVGFSTILFALNAVGTQLFHGDSMVCIALSDLPPAIRQFVMYYFSSSIDRRWKPQLCLPSAFAPLIQVITSQASEPSRVSLCGHLAGAVGAAIMLRRWFLISVPVQAALLILGRSSLLRRRCGEGSDWVSGLSHVWKNIRSPVALWSASKPEVLQGPWTLGFSPGDRVRIVGLRREPALRFNGLDGTIVALDELQQRIQVSLFNHRHTISVSPENVLALRSRYHADENPRGWTVSQVESWLKESGYLQWAPRFVQLQTTGSKLRTLDAQDLVDMNMPRHRVQALLAEVRKLFNDQ